MIKVSQGPRYLGWGWKRGVENTLLGNFFRKPKKKPNYTFHKTWVSVQLFGTVDFFSFTLFGFSDQKVPVV